jgi:DNA-binding beta-propeller fold protein YncE
MIGPRDSSLSKPNCTLCAVTLCLMLFATARAADAPVQTDPLSIDLKRSTGFAIVTGMPAVLDPTNLYSEAGAGHLSPAVSGALERVYVPDVQSNRVDVIDPVRNALPS